MNEDFIKGYMLGIKAENENAIRTLEEILYSLKQKRENGEKVIAYWSVKEYLEDAIKQLRIGGEK